MNYPTNLPLSAVSVNLHDGVFSGLYDIVWSVRYEVKNWQPTDDYGLCMFLKQKDNFGGGGVGIDLGYSGDINALDSREQGMKGGVVGIGLDTHGTFAEETVWTSGTVRDGTSTVYNNSITVRGGEVNNFKFIKHKQITDFNLLSDGVKTLRARLGNYGSTLYLDYRPEGSTEYINILTTAVEINLQENERLIPGVSFATPLTSNNSNILIDVISFHVEGNDVDPILDPAVIESVPEPLLPIQVKSTYTDTPPSAPESTLIVKSPPVPGIIMCNPLSAELTASKISTTGPYSVNDPIIYTVTVKNTGATAITNITLTESEIDIYDINDPTGLFTGLSELTIDQSVSASFSYKVTQEDINTGTHETTSTITSDIGTETVTKAASIIQATPGNLVLEVVEDSIGPYVSDIDDIQNIVVFKVFAENTGEANVIADPLESTILAPLTAIDENGLFDNTTIIPGNTTYTAELEYSVLAEDVLEGEIFIQLKSGTILSNLLSVDNL